MTNTTRKDELVSDYWDFYKEVHGCRPRHINFDACSEVELEEMLASLSMVAKEVFAEQEEREKAAIAKFEALVVSTIAAGAKDRETAMRWIMEGSESCGDWDYYAYANGIPYGYFRNIV